MVKVSFLLKFALKYSRVFVAVLLHTTKVYLLAMLRCSKICESV